MKQAQNRVLSRRGPSQHPHRHCPTKELGRTLRRTGKRKQRESVSALAIDNICEPELENSMN